jgi:hypothetical protein
MPLPTRVQDKIDNYQTILVARYPPNIPYWKLSTGYSKNPDAQADTTPAINIYTSDDSQPKLSSTIYQESSKTNLYNGSSLWFHLFNSSGTSLSTVIQIDSIGRVINRTTF